MSVRWRESLASDILFVALSFVMFTSFVDVRVEYYCARSCNRFAKKLARIGAQLRPTGMLFFEGQWGEAFPT